MTDVLAKPCTAFAGGKKLFSGSAIEVALAIRSMSRDDATGSVLTFDDDTGRPVDFDLRGTEDEVTARLAEQFAGDATGSGDCGRDGDVAHTEEPASHRRPGRPKLGVVAREVTLLPRHWEWLAEQSGGASAALRRLVDEARKNGAERARVRAAQDAAYRFMAAMAGNCPGFEEATRALYAEDRLRFESEAAAWPDDIRDYATKLAFGSSGTDVDGT